MSSENQQSNVNLLCAKGCGFYGSPTTRNLCSKCYREAIRKEQAELHQQQAASASSQDAAAVGASTLAAPPASAGITAAADQPSPLSTDSSSLAIVSDEVSSSIDSTASDLTGYVSDGPLHSELQPPSVSGSGNSAPCDIASTVGAAGLAGPSVSAAQSLSSPFISVTPPAAPTIFPPGLSSPFPAITIPPSPGAATGASSSSPAISSQPERPEQTNRNRCWKCNKRVGLLGFQCRCGYYFCGQHRHADSHTCDFDYKSYERQQLSRANQKIVAEKVTKI